jgi:hypothetical protein
MDQAQKDSGYCVLQDHEMTLAFSAPLQMSLFEEVEHTAAAQPLELAASYLLLQALAALHGLRPVP